MITLTTIEAQARTRRRIVLLRERLRMHEEAEAKRTKQMKDDIARYKARADFYETEFFNLKSKGGRK